jgi:restriction endonuclease S subunit
MSEIAGIIDNLEIKIDKLLKKINSLDKKSQDLNIELAKSAHILQNQSQEIEDLKVKYETLKIANALLGSENHKRDTKSKINSLIREIDYCVAQLAD